MRPDLAAQLKITPYTAFRDAVLGEINRFIEEKGTEKQSISEKDLVAIEAFRAYWERGTTSGALAREDAKLILRQIYGRFARFMSALPRRIEAIRIKPEFSPDALRRGDAQRPADVTMLMLQLDAEKREKTRLAEEVKAVTQDYLDTLSDVETLKKQLTVEKAKTEAVQGDYNQLQHDYEELRALLVNHGITLPPRHQPPTPVLRRTVSECDVRRPSLGSSSRRSSLEEGRRSALSAVEALPKPILNYSNHNPLIFQSAQSQARTSTLSVTTTATVNTSSTLTTHKMGGDQANSNPKYQ